MVTAYTTQGTITPKKHNEAHQRITRRSDEYVKSIKVDAPTDHSDSPNDLNAQRNQNLLFPSRKSNGRETASRA
jgi:hypothetical protein